MKVSARNVFKGKITQLQPGAVNAEVTLATTGGDVLVAIVTSSSVKTLGLTVGEDVVALVKAPWVMLSTQDANWTFSARNQLQGTVTSITKGAVNSEVGLALAGGSEVFAVVTNEAVSELNLQPGSPATAIIKASHIILASPR